MYNTRMSNTRHPGQRAGLTRERVLAAARSVAVEDGTEAVTMRRLAEELGVMPNAIYTYFPGKEALLDTLLDSLLGEIDIPDPESVDWRDGLAHIMDASRRLLVAHPRLVEPFLSRPALGPNAARLGEATLRLLARAGVEGEQAVTALRALLAYTMGYAALQAARRGDRERAERGEAAFRSLSADEFTSMRHLAAPLARPPSDGQFRTGLTWLLDRIGGGTRHGDGEGDDSVPVP